MSSIIWKGHLTIGDLKIAARLFSGPDAHQPGLKRIHTKCGQPAGNSNYCKGGCLDLTSKDIGSAAELDGRLIPLTAEHLASIKPERQDTLPLIFVPSTAVDPLFHESTYYVHPDGDGEKDFGGLRQVMVTERWIAVTKIVLQRERFLIVRPGPKGLIAHTLYFGLEAKLLSEFRTDDVPFASCRRIYAAAVPLQGSFDPSTTVDPYPAKLHQLVKSLAADPPKKPAAKAKRSRRAA